MTGNDVSESRNAEIQRQKLIRILRFTGAGFIMAGTVVALDLGGIGALLGFGDSAGLIGGVFAFVGIMDLVVVPAILEHAARRPR